MSDEVVTEPGWERRAAELIARAEDFRRHGEDGSADAALALAEKIMIKYALDAAVVAARATSSDRSIEKIVTRTMDVVGIYRIVLGPQLALLLAATGAAVRTFTQRWPRAERLYVIGYASEVDALLVLATSIQLQVISAVSRWWYGLPGWERLPGMDGYKMRRQFVSSFVQGARERIELARATALGQAGPGTDLALASRRRPVDEYVNLTYDLVNHNSRVKAGGHVAANAGLAAGRQANTGDPTVGNVRRQITS